MRPKNDEPDAKDHIINCKSALLGIMRKSPDIKEIRIISKAISELDKALDLI